ncbi:MAG: hypothetical protein WC845_02660 [Candidatus Staskawiczbacteria bacterium]|jgi:uncharacterized membrane protein
MEENTPNQTTGGQTPPEPKKEQPAVAKKVNVMAILAYVIFFIPLLTDSKNDPFVKYHVRQGALVFFIFIVSWILGFIPGPGWGLSQVISFCGLILMIIGIVNVSQGKEVPLPLIGKYADKIDI